MRYDILFGTPNLSCTDLDNITIQKKYRPEDGNPRPALSNKQVSQCIRPDFKVPLDPRKWP